MKHRTTGQESKAGNVVFEAWERCKILVEKVEVEFNSRDKAYL